MLIKIVHPLSANQPGHAENVSIVPTYLDSVPNKVQMKFAFLDIIKPEE